MKTRFATTCFFVGALLVPAVGYTADTQGTPPKTEKAKDVIDDTVITSKIKAEYAKDKQVGALNIKVDTDKGMVTLSGNAKSKEEADKAASIAQSTKGVVSVKNNIHVLPSDKKY